MSKTVLVTGSSSGIGFEVARYEGVLSESALLGRVGEVRDIAEAVRYLAEASFVTGQILNVDGGYVAGRR